MKNIEKHFGSVIALNGVSLDVYPGECHCLLGDNGAASPPSSRPCRGAQADPGEILFEGKPMHFEDPRDAITAGIATVYQDLAMIPLMSVSRNFFMGNEPTRSGSDRSSSSTMSSPTSHHGRDAQDGDQPARTRPGGGHACRAASARPWRLPGRCISAPRC
jgi:ABC-type sugar transport system ATPase subunit